MYDSSSCCIPYQHLAFSHYNILRYIHTYCLIWFDILFSIFVSSVYKWSWTILINLLLIWSFSSFHFLWVHSSFFLVSYSENLGSHRFNTLSVFVYICVYIYACMYTYIYILDTLDIYLNILIVFILYNVNLVSYIFLLISTFYSTKYINM